MTPIPVGPSVVVYFDPARGLVAAGNNIAPDLNVVVVDNANDYKALVANKPFDSANPNPQTQVLAMRK